LLAAAFGTRHVQALLLTGGFLCCYAMRVVMSVAVVAMVDDTKPQVCAPTVIATYVSLDYFAKAILALPSFRRAPLLLGYYLVKARTR
jgi:hypothetical protein